MAIILATAIIILLKIRPHTQNKSRLKGRTHGALNDTSLASVTTDDGNRHLFFQDINGTLRHVEFSHALNMWSTDSDLIHTKRPPRLYTPLTAISVVSPDAEAINIYYFDVNDRLAATRYQHGYGYLDKSIDILNSSFPVSSKSRSLSVIRVDSDLDSLSKCRNRGPKANGFSCWYDFLLFFEDHSGKLTVLHGKNDFKARYHNPGYEEASTWVWHDLSKPFRAQIPEDFSVGSPFVVAGFIYPLNSVGGLFLRIKTARESVSSSIDSFFINNVRSSGGVSLA